MQLVEYFLWNNQNFNTNKHQFWSVMILITLILQVAAFYGGCYPLRNRINDTTAKFMDITFGITIVASIYGLCIAYKKYGKFKTNPICKATTKYLPCRLEWSILTEFKKSNIMYTIFMIGYLITVFLATYIIFGYIGLGLGLSSFVMVSLYVKLTNSSAAAGGLWCFSIIILAILFGIFENDTMPYFENEANFTKTN